MELFKTPHIKFMKYKYVALAVTVVIVLAGVLNITVFHGLKPGVDFGGGTLIRVEFKDPTSVGQVRKQLADVGLGGSTIQETGKKGHEYQIRTTQVVKGADAQQEMEAHEKLADKVIEALRANGRAGQADGRQPGDGRPPGREGPAEKGHPGDHLGPHRDAHLHRRPVQAGVRRRRHLHPDPGRPDHDEHLLVHQPRDQPPHHRRAS